MLIEPVDVKSVLKDRATCEDMLKAFGDKFEREDRYNIICSIFACRKRLHIRNDELLSFIKKFIPNDYCVYKLYWKDELVYVGSSKCVEVRIGNHTINKSFDKVLVCQQATNEEMLNFENYLILKYKPKLNKDANLKRASMFSGDEDNKEFIPLQEYLWEKPIRKQCDPRIYDHFTGKAFKYYKEKLSKGNANAYNIQTSNSTYNDYDGDYGESFSSFIEKDGFNFPLMEELEKNDLMQYIVEDCPTQNQFTFAETYVFTLSGKYRYQGTSKWRDIDNESLFKMIKSFADEYLNTVGKPKLPRIFSFGKYKGLTVDEVFDKDGNYINWCLNNLKTTDLLKLGLMSYIDEF